MSREVMQMALEALNRAKPACFADTTITAIDDAITALRQALETEQEPLYWNVADGWVYADDTSQERVDEKAKREHEWVGLTEEEKIELWNKHENHWRFEDNLMAFTRAIEQALKEKNI